MLHVHLPRGVGVRRREAIQVGSSSLMGLSLTSTLGRPTLAADSQRAPITPRAKSVVIVFQTGACSHLDTWDLKPDAPVEVRGPFKPIATPVAGLHVSELLPHLAKRAEHYAIVRSFSHRDNNHLMSTHHVLTGHIQPGGFFDKIASRDDWPCYAAALDYLRPPSRAVPSGVHLPTFLMSPPLTWPGQHGGLLDAKHDPWQITGDPQSPDFRVDNLRLAEGLDVNRFVERQELLASINAQQDALRRTTEHRRLNEQQQLAFSLLTSQPLTQAFELNRESEATRDRYGRHTYGQSLLLARRLVEVGVPVVQVNVGRVQTWDNHGNIFPTLKDRLVPPLDQGMGAFLDDLVSSGLIDQTLVVMLGEFGRTPKINAQAGRDHWGYCFSGLFAGAGVRGGQVIGKSDAEGGFPLTAAYAPDDLGATIYQALGIDPGSKLVDRQGRPAELNHGTPIHALYSGANVS